MPRNPFGTTGGWYVNPTLRDNLESTIATGVATPAEVAVLNQMKEIPSAFWIDHYGKISGTGRLDTLEGILEDAAAKADPPLCVFIFYDLPNRDCNAKASNGEISFRGDDAADVALAEYRTQYVDPFVAILARYSSVPVVIVVEPDSLGNVISNAGRNGCSEATVNNYKAGIKYAVDALSIARSSSSAATLALYVDAAHGGWMGYATRIGPYIPSHTHSGALRLYRYEPNAQAFVSLMVEIGILDKIRGFSTNVANYQVRDISCDSCMPLCSPHLTAFHVHSLCMQSCAHAASAHLAARFALIAKVCARITLCARGYRRSDSRSFALQRLLRKPARWCTARLKASPSGARPTRTRAATPTLAM